MSHILKYSDIPTYGTKKTREIVSRLFSWIPIMIMVPNFQVRGLLNIGTIDPLDLDYITSVLQDEKMSFDVLMNAVLFRNQVSGVLEDILSMVEMKEILESSNLTIEKINNLFNNLDNYLDKEWQLFLETV